MSVTQPNQRMSNSKIVDSDLPQFWELLKQRVSVNKPTMYILYFAVVIGILGLIGCLFSAVTWIVQGWGPGNINALSFFQNLSTYAIAIAATSLVDFVISEKVKDNSADLWPGRNHFSLLLFGGFFVVSFLSVWIYLPTNRWVAALLVVIATIASWTIWWIANAENTKLMERLPSQNSALGGDTKSIKRDTSSTEGGLNQ